MILLSMILLSQKRSAIALKKQTKKLARKMNFDKTLGSV